MHYFKDYDKLIFTFILITEELNFQKNIKIMKNLYKRSLKIEAILNSVKTDHGKLYTCRQSNKMQNGEQINWGE